MSRAYEPIPPEQASAYLTDETPNRNDRLVKPHPYRQGVYISVAPGQRCLSCGFQVDTKTSKCPRCGSQSLVKFEKDELIDVVPVKVSAHLVKRIRYCWHQSEDPMTGEVRKHQFVEEIVPVVHLKNGEWFKETRCKNCGGTYTRFEGRAATPEELEKARAGKIELATEKMLGRN